MKRGWAAAVLAVTACGVAATWLPFISDDALISFRYAERAARGLGLTWTEGERVEGYTDFLWVLLNVPASWLHVDTIWWARGLGVAGLLTAVRTVGLGAKGAPLSLGRLTAGLLLATSAPLTVWAVGGLEHTFLAGLLAVALVGAVRALETERWWPVAWALAACVLTRADGVVLVVGTLAGVIVTSFGAVPFSRLLRRVVTVAGAPSAAWLAQTVCRRAYYGEWVPNTALAKVAFSAQRVHVGVEWVKRGFIAAWPLLLVAVFAVWLVMLTPRRRQVVTPLVVALSWFSYVALVGGDIFPAWRQLVPGFLALAVVIGEGFAAVEGTVGALRSRAWLVLTAVILTLHVHVQWRDGDNRLGATERWEWTGEPLGRSLAAMTASLSPRPLLAIDAAGALPYWSQLPALDMLGLNDAWIPRHPPPGFGTGTIGHDLGDGAYVLRRKPDLIAFCGACGAVRPCFSGGKQLIALPDFVRDYGLAFVASSRCLGVFWVRHADGPLSIKRDERRVELSAWQLASSEEAPLAQAADGQAEVKVDARTPAIAEFVLPAGTWRLDDTSLDVSWRCDGGRSASWLRSGSTLELSRPTRVQLALFSSVARTVRGLTLERTDDPPSWRCVDDEPIAAGASSLQHDYREHDGWNRAGMLVFGPRGARVELDLPPAESLRFFTDNNDAYTLTWWAGGEPLGSVMLPPAPNGGGLVERRVPWRPGATAMTLSAEGDGAYAVGGFLGR